jgi:hypothetical protein
MRKLLAAAAIALTMALSASPALANHDEPGESQGKAYVCKYVGTPGVDETLQTGQNPIEVSVNALEGEGFAGVFPFAFEDAQGNSVAIGYSGNGHPELTVDDCPQPQTPSPTPSPSESPSPTVSPSPSDEPTPSETPPGEDKDCDGGRNCRPQKDLAQTGAETLILGGIATALAGLGGLSVWAGRKQK